MSELPKEWVTTKLGEICSKPQYGYTTRAASEGKIRFLRTTDITKGLNWLSVPYCEVNPEKPEQYLLQPGDIVISRAGSVGFSALIESVPGNAVFASYLIRFRPLEGILGKYLKRYLESDFYWQQITEKAAGNALQNVNAQKLADLDVVVAPIAEQARIAQKLDELLAQVDTLKARIDAIPALLKRFRQSVLAAAVSGRLTEEWREARCLPETSADLLAHTKAEKLSWVTENSDHNEAKRVFKRASGFDAGRLEAHSLPDGWCWAGLEDVVLLVVDCHNKTAPYQEAGVALVRTTNIRDGAFLWEDLRHVSEETYAYWSRRCVPEPGDIVFTREAPMGEAAIIPPSTKLCLGQRTMLFRCVNGGTSAGYLLLTLLDPIFKARSEDIAVGTGVKHFRVGDVSDLKIPVAPKEEQTEIVRRVEQLFAFADQLEAKVATAQARIDRLTQSILAKAFRGELVPQDPNDEPASLLLERIQAQRAAAPKAKRGRKSA